MADSGFGDFFISDVDDEPIGEDDDLIVPPVVVPHPAPAPSSASVPSGVTVQESVVNVQPSPPQHVVAAETIAQPVSVPADLAEHRPVARPTEPTREERLADALNRLMDDSQEIEAAALVSLDGFTMASALPEGMHEDRVGAMSAAILGLGERAAAELGKGALSQVFIEGEDGYVLLIAAGGRAVLTCLAGREAKLGLVLYDMRAASTAIAGILG